MSSDIRSVKVSPNVLKMQFMKKTTLHLEKVAKEKRKLELADTNVGKKQSKIYSSVQTIEDEPTSSLNSVLNEERFTVLEDLRFGRFSFNGQNPEIEKLMVYHECIRTGVEPPADNFEDGELMSIEEGDEEAELRKMEEPNDEYEVCKVYEGDAAHHNDQQPKEKPYKKNNNFGARKKITKRNYDGPKMKRKNRKK